MRPENPLAGLLYDVCMAVRARNQQKNPFAAFSFKDLEAISDLRKCVAGLEDLFHEIEDGLAAESRAPLAENQAEAVRRAYDAARFLGLPACSEFSKWTNAISGLTYAHSLTSIPLETLRALEVRGHADSSLGALIRAFTFRLAKTTGVEDHGGFGQAFELFSEALVYEYLRTRLDGVEKIDEQGGRIGSTPDFKCTHGGKVFFIEVKSFDIVDGVYRAGELTSDGLNANIGLESQLKSGRSVAISELEVAPFKRAFGDPNYDPRNLVVVIEAIKSKAKSAFKRSQFELGPTFAFAVMGRLLIPGGAKSVLPYYTEKGPDGVDIVSGVLWQLCFGR